VNVDQYVQIYHGGGLAALNGALEALDEQHPLDVLDALQKNGCKIMRHEDKDHAGRKDGGIVTGRSNAQW
jgi:hypothetical protein